MARRIRIKDIAEMAGVSKGTVDRVLHNRGHVSPITRKKVLQAVEELGYQPNIIASALAYNRTWRIAALIPKPEDDPFWQQPKIGIRRALKAVQDYGLSVDFFHFRDADTQDFETEWNPERIGDLDREELLSRFTESMQTPTQSDRFFGEVFVLLPKDRTVRVQKIFPAAGAENSDTSIARLNSAAEETSNQLKTADSIDTKVARLLDRKSDRPVLLILRRKPAEPDGRHGQLDDLIDMSNRA